MSKQPHWMNANTPIDRVIDMQSQFIQNFFLSFQYGGPMALLGALFSSILCTSLTGIFRVYVINGK